MDTSVEQKVALLGQNLLITQKKILLLKKLAVHIAKRKDSLHLQSVLLRFGTK